MNIIEDIAANKSVSWGEIAQKIDENFSELQNNFAEINTVLETIIEG